MKPYLLFVGSQFYPSGGWADFKSSHDTVEDCLRAVVRIESGNDWYQIVELETGRLIENYHAS